MDLIELPLAKHYIIFTHKGFSTFMFNGSNEDSFNVQDIPLRFCFNAMKSDPSNIAMIQAEKDLYERFKFFAIKYFGMPILADMRLKDVIAEYEKPLGSLLLMHAEEHNAAAILEKIAAIDPKNTNKELQITDSPLFVFTRNGVPDLD